MDHDLAVKNNAAERYLLGELNEVEIEEYEEHYFSCPMCAQEVKLGSEFIDHAREIFKTDFLPELQKAPVAKSTTWGRFWSSLRQPAPAFACALLAVVGGFSVYQNSVIADLKKPEILASEAVFRNDRADAKWIVKAQVNEAVHIAFEIPVSRFTSYEVDVLTESGSSKLPKPISVSAEEANDTITMRFPQGVLEAGKYTLVIQGVNSNTSKSQAQTEIARYPFEVQLQK